MKIASWPTALVALQCSAGIPYASCFSISVLARPPSVINSDAAANNYYKNVGRKGRAAGAIATGRTSASTRFSLFSYHQGLDGHRGDDDYRGFDGVESSSDEIRSQYGYSTGDGYGCDGDPFYHSGSYDNHYDNYENYNPLDNESYFNNADNHFYCNDNVDVDGRYSFNYGGIHKRRDQNNDGGGSLAALSVAELKRLLDDRRVDYRDCLEKRDLIDRLLTSRPADFASSNVDSDLAPEENRVVGVFTKASPSVAYIQTVQQQHSLVRGLSLKGTEVPTGAGSGFVWDDQVGRLTTAISL